jgi:hypothetical protein
MEYSESYIEEQTTQWTKEKLQKDKQPSTKHTQKTKDRVTRTPLNPFRLCQSYNDPHITTFDGKLYHYMNIGEFVMYRNDKGPFWVCTRLYTIYLYLCLPPSENKS